MHLVDLFNEAEFDLMTSKVLVYEETSRAFGRWSRARRYLFDYLTLHGPQVVMDTRYWAEGGTIHSKDVKPLPKLSLYLEALSN